MRLIDAPTSVFVVGAHNGIKTLRLEPRFSCMGSVEDGDQKNRHHPRGLAVTIKPVNLSETSPCEAGPSPYFSGQERDQGGVFQASQRIHSVRVDALRHTVAFKSPTNMEGHIASDGVADILKLQVVLKDYCCFSLIPPNDVGDHLHRDPRPVLGLKRGLARSPEPVGSHPKNAGEGGDDTAGKARDESAVLVRPVEDGKDRGRYDVPTGAIIWTALYGLSAYLGVVWAKQRYGKVVEAEKRSDTRERNQ